MVIQAEAVERIRLMLREERPHLVASVNPEICVAARKNAALRHVLLSADLGTPDGIGIVLSSRLRGGRVRERVTGIDLMMDLLEVAVKEHYSVYFLGAAEGVAAAAAQNLTKRFPGLQVAGTHHGYITAAEEIDVAQQIADSGAHMVFIGMGSPRQEMFMANHAAATGARVLMVVGGSFDVLSGRVPRAPRIYQRLGFEWLYRLFQHPRRFKRILVLPYFLLLTVIKGD